jgi:hypothetical protein
MTSHRDYFRTYQEDSTTVTLVNNSVVKAAGRGDVLLPLPIRNESDKRVLSERRRTADSDSFDNANNTISS